jgi:UDP-2,4-diacetamido-2,4,6-trideoxy-beta-L-altropyranose hydrolase
MRCLALGQAWQDAGGQAVFLMAGSASSLDGRLRGEGMEVLHHGLARGSEADAAQTAKMARECGASWVVADGYCFGRPFQDQVRSAGLDLLVIDDNGENRSYSANLVLNQNLHAEECLYRDREPETRLLLGTDYILLRREFRQAPRPRRSPAGEVKSVLVTLGGADPDNASGLVLDALDRLRCERLSICLIAGAANPHYESLLERAARSRHTVEIARNVRDMPARMARADLAVAAAGSTVWELCYMGVPACVLALAENQKRVAASLQRTGAALACPDGLPPTEDLTEVLASLLNDPVRRAELTERGSALVDGGGAIRVCEVLQ